MEMRNLRRIGFWCTVFFITFILLTQSAASLQTQPITLTWTPDPFSVELHSTEILNFSIQNVGNAETGNANLTIHLTFLPTSSPGEATLDGHDEEFMAFSGTLAFLETQLIHTNVNGTRLGVADWIARVDYNSSSLGIARSFNRSVFILVWLNRQGLSTE